MKRCWRRQANFDFRWCARPGRRRGRPTVQKFSSSKLCYSSSVQSFLDLLGLVTALIRINLFGASAFVTALINVEPERDAQCEAGDIVVNAVGKEFVNGAQQADYYKAQPCDHIDAISR